MLEMSIKVQSKFGVNFDCTFIDISSGARPLPHKKIRQNHRLPYLIHGSFKLIYKYFCEIPVRSRTFTTANRMIL